MIYLLKDIVKFCISPQYVERQNISLKKTLIMNSKIFVISISIIIPTLSLFSVFSDFVPPPTLIHKSLKEKFLFVIIVAPIIEEMIFRFPLNSSKWSFFFSLSLVISIISIFLNIENSYITFATWILFLFGLLAHNFFEVSYYFQNIWKTNYRYFIYFFVLFFGLIHLSNFEIGSFENWVFLPVLFLPQTIFGFILVYVRLNYGIISSIIQHSFYNFFILIIDTFL
jgi:membrane protease YdiL (CAAX protease family)